MNKDILRFEISVNEPRAVDYQHSFCNLVRDIQTYFLIFFERFFLELENVVLELAIFAVLLNDVEEIISTAIVFKLDDIGMFYFSQSFDLNIQGLFCIWIIVNLTQIDLLYSNHLTGELVYARKYLTILSLTKNVLSIDSVVSYSFDVSFHLILCLRMLKISLGLSFLSHYLQRAQERKLILWEYFKKYFYKITILILQR